MKRTTYVLLIVTLVIAIDQITKYLIVTYLNLSDSVKIFSFLHLVSIRNTGAAFGMFKSLGNVFFIIVSVIAILFVLWLMVRGKEGYFSLSLILGGATGNLIDRIVYGHVVDFIDLSIGKFHWYAFNIADSALTVGVIMFFLGSTLLKHRAKH
ncbi:MAG: signal peptidase II [Nitrospira sp.]|nr:signal peptidase II [Nitrospira sp.]